MKLDTSNNPEARERRLYGAALGLIMLLLVIPMWIVTIPGMVDYTNHLTRCYIMAHYASHPEFVQRYIIGHVPLPNLGMDLIVTALARFLPIQLAGRIFFTFSAALFVVGCAYLGRVLTGKRNWLALVAAFFFYNSTLLFGFMNYMLGLGVFMVAFAFWLRCRDRMTVVRFLLCCGLSIVAFLTHLSCIMFLFVACVTVALVEFLRHKKFLQLVVQLAWLACPGILMSFFMGKGGGAVGAIKMATLSQKFVRIFTPVVSYHVALDAVVVLALVIATILLAKGARLHKGALVAFVFFVLFLISPNNMFSGSAIDSRYVMPAFLIFVLSVDLDWGPKQKRVVAALLLLLCIRLAITAADWVKIDRRSQKVLAMGDVLPQNARIDSEGASLMHGAKLDRGFASVVNLWTISHGAFVSGLFHIPGQQPLTFRPPVCEVKDSTDCIAQFDYVWTQEPRDAGVPTDVLRTIAEPVAQWEEVTLWRIRKDKLKTLPVE